MYSDRKVYETALLFLWIMGVLYVIYILEQLVFSALSQNDSNLQLLTTLNGLLLKVNSSLQLVHLAAACMILRWFYRVYSNLHLLIKDGLYAKSWAIWGWFVPFLNLVIPYRIMKNLFSRTEELVGNVSYEISERNKKLVNNWWALMLFTVIISNLVGFIVIVKPEYLPGNKFTIVMLTIYIANIALT